MDNSEYGCTTTLTLRLLLQCSKLQGGRIGEVRVAWLVVLLLQALVQLREVWMLPLTRGCQSAGDKREGEIAAEEEKTVVFVYVYELLRLIWTP